MKIIFVDAENVGFRGLDAIETNLIDKVFAFSRVASIQTYCQQKLFLCLSGYPEGANQADFYIIAYLSRMLAMLSKEQKQVIEFILYSNDINLIDAFNFQCGLLGAKSSIVGIKADTLPVISHAPKLSSSTQQAGQKTEQKILNMLKTPQGLFAIQQTLHLSQADFSKAFNRLRDANKIKRCSKNGKNWQRV